MDNDSILNSVKLAIGYPPEQMAFDNIIIMHINSVFMILAQAGVGPKNGFRITDDSSEWTDFLSSDDENFESVKSYVCLKVRILFDPPSNATHMQSLKDMINEFEWRLNIEAEIT